MLSYAVCMINTKRKSYATDVGDIRVAESWTQKWRVNIAVWKKTWPTAAGWNMFSLHHNLLKVDFSGASFYETMTSCWRHLQRCWICVKPSSRVRSIAWRKLNAMSTIDAKSIAFDGLYQPPFTNQSNIWRHPNYSSLQIVPGFATFRSGTISTTDVSLKRITHHDGTGLTITLSIYIITSSTF